MKKTLLEFYGLAVCFICVLMLAFNLTNTISNLVKFYYPAYGFDTWHLEKYQSNDEFCSGTSAFKNNETKCKNLTEDQITKKREAAYQKQLENNKLIAIQTIIFGLIMLFVNLLIFIPHWIIARNARNAACA